MNAITEHWIRGCRRKLPDRTLVWNQSHLQQILRDYRSTQTSTSLTFHARGGAAETAARTGRS
jgi:hypothetical protein